MQLKGSKIWSALGQFWPEGHASLPALSHLLRACACLFLLWVWHKHGFQSQMRINQKTIVSVQIKLPRIKSPKMVRQVRPPDWELDAHLEWESAARASKYKSAAGAQPQSSMTTDCDRNLSRQPQLCTFCIIYWDAIDAVTAERTNNGIFVMLLRLNKKLCWLGARGSQSASAHCIVYCILGMYLEVSISLLVSGQPCTIVMVSFCGSMGVPASIYNHFSIHDQTWYCPKFICIV
jgi:hypothetical protein